MGRFLAIVMFGSVAVAQLSFANTTSQQSNSIPPTPTLETAPGVPPAAPKLPTVPAGTTTVIGGAIRSVDPVRDQITLKVFGGSQMKILYDARTQYYRDGVKTPLTKLHSENHASVETVLDGTKVFAISIHTLSRSPEGESQGQVLSYNPTTRELTIGSVLSREPIQLNVPEGTPIVRTGQAAAASASATSTTSDLVKGTLVSVQFRPGNKGHGIASQIAILAVPGTTFVFSGNVSFLDLHARRMVLLDPRDNQSYTISFDPAQFPVSQKMHVGDHLTVKATYDGVRYVASAIKADGIVAATQK